MTHAELLRSHADAALRDGGMYYSGEYLSRIAATAESLEAENAKLRELVARVERARRDLCDAYPDAELLNCEDCPAWSACKGDLMDRMREIGIEVNG